MIKGIIEKIIVNYFGKFIKGVEKQNLTVDLLGGNFKLQNINLNNQYFDNLDLPIKLVYSSIGKLNMQVPLSKISSVPVECILDSVFIILQFQQDMFTNLQKNNAQKKRKVIEKYAKQALENFLTKLKDDKKEEGLMSKIGMKIIDNLQLKFRNFHIRFEENNNDKQYAWGVTFQQLVLITTDQNCKPFFIDRSVQSNKNSILYKTMNLKNFNLYWHSSNVQFFKNLTNVTIQQKMLNLITQKNTQKILSITSQFKLVINPTNRFDVPIYMLEILLQPIDIVLEQKQVSQIIDFAEKKILQNQLKHLSKKKIQKIQNLQELKLDFEAYMKNFLLETENIPQVSNNTIQIIYEVISTQQLLIWTASELKKVVKKTKIEDLMRKKKVKTWFGGASNTIVQITADQLIKLEELVENIFQNERQLNRTSNMAYFSIKLNIPQGKFAFIKMNQNFKEILEFSYQRINMELQKSQDDTNFDVKLKVRAINFDLISYKNQQQKKVNIFSNIIIHQNQEQFEFFKLQYNKKLQKNLESVSTIIKIQKLICTYRYLFLKKFKEFFTFRSVDQIIKTTTLEKYQKITGQAREKKIAIDRKNRIEIFIKSPTLLIPFYDASDLQSDCWICNFGDLIVNSVQNSDDQSFKHYEFYNIKLKNVNLRYYPSINMFYQQIQGKDDQLIKGKEQIFSIVNNLNFDVLLKQRRAFVDSQKFYKTITNIKLSKFELKFSEKQYQNYIYLKNIFNESDKDILERQRKEKQQIERFMVCEGFLKKKNEKVKNWIDYYAILSGAYLYFYNDKKELQFSEKAYIKNSQIEIKYRQLKIFNKYQKCHLLFELNEELYKWKSILQYKIKQYATNIQLIELYETPQIKIQQKYQKKTAFNFFVDEMMFVYNDNQNVEIINFNIKNLKFVQASQTNQERIIVNLQEFQFLDKIFIYKNKEYQPLFIIKSSQKECITIRYYEQKSANDLKQNQNRKINIKIPHITVNWKPDVLLTIIELIKKYINKNKNLSQHDIQMKNYGQKSKKKSILSDLTKDYKFMKLKSSFQQNGRYVKDKRMDYLSYNTYKNIKNVIHMLLNIDFQIAQINANLMHRQTHVIMFHLFAEKLYLNVVLAQDENFILGILNQATIYEMTNYPKTKNSNLQFDKIKPTIIFKKKSNSHHQKIVQFKCSFFQESQFHNKERISLFLSLIFTPCQYSYYQQVTFRLIDYIMIQIVLLIDNPHMVIANQNLLMELNRNKVTSEKPIMILGELSQIAKNLVCPFFSDIYVQAQDVSIILKSEPEAEDYFIINCESGVASNIQKKDPKRFLKAKKLEKELLNYIWEEEYNIQAKNISIFIIEKQNIIKKFGLVDLKVCFNRLTNQDTINHIYSNVSDYDRAFHITSQVTPLKVSINRFEYLQIVKLLNFNITYDDEMQGLFIHNYKIIQMLQPKEINVKVTFPNFIFNSNIQSEQEIKLLFSLNIQPMQILYKRTKKRDHFITIQTSNLRLHKFYNQIQYPLAICPQIDSEGQITKIEIQLRTTGQKFICFSVESAKILYSLADLSLILQWIHLVDDVFPIYSNDLNEIGFSLNINKAVILMQSTKKILKHGFATLGAFSFKYIRYANKTESYYTNMLKNNKLNKQEFENIPENILINLSLSIQMFRCKTSKFFETPFILIGKRNIVQPFSINYTDKKRWRIADQQNFVLKNCSTKFINIDKGIAKISFKDFILFQKIMKEEKENEHHFNNMINMIKQNSGNSILVPQIVFQQMTQQGSLDILLFKAECLLVYIINDCGQSFVPILYLELQQCNMNNVKTIKKTIREYKFICNINYFNGNISKWQPLLQKTPILMQYNCRTRSNSIKQTKVSIQSDQQIALNISKQFINAIYYTKKEWMNTIQQQQYVKDINKKNTEEPIEFVSHYIIVNETGYPLEIYDMNKNFKVKIQKNMKANYDVQLQDYDVQDQKIIINIKLFHPKHKFKMIEKININSNRFRKIHLTKEDGQKYDFPLILRTNYLNQRQNFYICSQYYSLNKIDNNEAKSKPLPFDIDSRKIQISGADKLVIDIQKLKKADIEVDNYRYALIENKKNMSLILEISHKLVAINLLPVEININGRNIKPNYSTGFVGQLLINGEKIKQTYYKTTKIKHQIYIYCESYIIDYFGMEFAIGEKKGNSLKMFDKKYIFKEELSNNQTANVLILPSNQQKISVKPKEKKNFIKPFDLPLGRFFIEYNDEASYAQFSIYSYLKPLIDNNTFAVHDDFVYKVIELTPRYMIVNSSQYKLKINQVNSIISTFLEPNQRQPFFWQNKHKPKQFYISLFDETQFYSKTISLEQNSQCFTLRKAANLKQFKIFVCELQHTDNITFINIAEKITKFQLENRIENSLLVVYQSYIFQSNEVLETHDLMFEVKYGQKVPFAYEFPMKSRKLTVTATLNIHNQKQQIIYQSIQVDLQSNLFEINLKPMKFNHNSLVVNLKLQFEGNTKKLVIHNKIQDPKDDEPEIQFSFHTSKLGISIIGSAHDRRTQLLFIHLHKFIFEFLYDTEKISYFIGIQKIRLENVRASKVYYQTICEIENPPALQFKLSRNRYNSRLIHYVGISIDKSVVNITSEQIKIIYENIKQIQFKLEELNMQEEKLIADYDFTKRALAIEGEKFYFIMAQIYPFKSVISFKNVGNWGGKIFKTFANINQSTLKLDGMVTQHFTTKNLKEFFYHIGKHYREKIVVTLLPLIGNMSILGNPISLVNRIGVGFKDFYELPNEGFHRGPLEGGKGIAKGARSLFKNTFQGAFNSVEAFTDTIGSGMASLVYDDKFNKQRQKIRNQRSQHVFEGLYSGGKSLINGIGNGLKGVVMDPYNGAQKNGVGGFFLGGVKGIAGLVLKPMSGLFDATTKTAQGIKNTANYLTPSQRQKKMARLHYPRIFYTQNREYRAYDIDLAYIHNRLSIQNEKYENLNWQSYFKIQNNILLLITYEYIILYEIAKEKVIKEYECKLIKSCTQDQIEFDKVVFKFKMGKNNKDDELKIIVKQFKKKLIKEIKPIIQYHNED